MGETGVYDEIVLAPGWSAFSHAITAFVQRMVGGMQYAPIIGSWAQLGPFWQYIKADLESSWVDMTGLKRLYVYGAHLIDKCDPFLSFLP
jgi:hypothetical protein